jgi:hypothetical protein
MPGETTAKNVFKNTQEGRRSAGKPRKRWLGGLENDLKKKVLEAEEKVKDTDAWKLILKEARVLHGPQSQWRERKSHWEEGLVGDFFRAFLSTECKEHFLSMRGIETTFFGRLRHKVVKIPTHLLWLPITRQY